MIGKVFSQFGNWLRTLDIMIMARLWQAVTIIILRGSRDSILLCCKELDKEKSL